MKKKLEKFEETSLKTPIQSSPSSFKDTDILNDLDHFSKKNSGNNTEKTTIQISAIVVPEKEKNDSVQPIWKEFELKDGNRYAVLKTLGEGGMGVVELVQDQLLGREVARKTIKMQQLTEMKSLSQKEKILIWRFKQEASITALLEHPNIIPLYEMQPPEQGKIQFTMRKVEGQTLRNLFFQIRTGKIEYEETHLLNIFKKVCEAIAYAHSKGVIHRDLKPDNVMVGKFGEVYVMDWGIAKRLGEDSKHVEEETLSSLLKQGDTEEFYKTIGGMGTLGYMSPEQQENASKVIPQSDIYALGKMLRECFTLLSPLEELEKVRKIRLHEKAKRKNIEETIPEEIEAIEKKATHENPAERYTSVQKMLADLERYQKNFKISAKDYGLIETFTKWIKRNRQKLTLSSFFFVLCFAFPFYYWRKGIQEKENQCKILLQKAEVAKQSGENIQSSENVTLKIQHFLEAFNFLEDILTLKPGDVDLETRKRELGKQLIQYTCQNKDYSLAEHIAKNLERLSILNEEEKKSYFQKIATSKTAILTQHLNRLKKIEDNFKTKQREEGDIENAIFEISKMQEKEIFYKLLELVEEGKQYLLENYKRDPKLIEFYQMIIDALGRLENPEAGKQVMSILQVLAIRIQSFPFDQAIPLEETEFMVKLAKALENMRATSVGKEFFELRYEMQSIRSSFFTRTETISRKLMQGAINSYSQTLDSTPENAEIYNTRGATKVDTGDIEGALKDFNEAIRLSPQSAHFYMNRGLAKQIKNDLDSAIADFNLALQIVPQLGEAYFNRGVTKKLKGDLDGAINDYTEAIRYKSQLLKAYENRGNLKKIKGDLNGALEDFNTAIQINPQFFEGYNSRGIVKDMKGDLEGALSDFTQAIHFNPQFVEAYNNRGILKRSQGNLEGALSDYTQAIQINPLYANAYCSRAFTKQLKGDLEGALFDYHEAIRLNPKLTKAYYERGSLKQSMGKYQEAIQDLNESIRLDPQYSEAYSERGFAKQSLEDIEGAIDDYSQALVLNPKSARIYNNRGLARQMKKNFKGAFEDFSEAILLEPQWAMPYCYRGVLLFNLKEKIKAKSDLQLFMKLTQNTKDSQLKTLRQQLISQFPDLK